MDKRLIYKWGDKCGGEGRAGFWKKPLTVTEVVELISSSIKECSNSVGAA